MFKNHRFAPKALALLLTLSLGGTLLASCGSKQADTEKKSSDAKKAEWSSEAANGKAANEGQSSTAEKKTVYTSIYPIYDFTRKLAGDDFDVRLMVPAGTEAHEWEPGTKDIAELSKASAMILSGAGMEHWADKVTKAANNPNLKVIDSSKGIDLIKAAEEKHEAGTDAHEEGLYDPHVWLAPRNVEIQAKNIAAALSALEPAAAERIKTRLNAQEKKLAVLDQQYTEQLKSFAGRKFISGHEAFAYLCRDYKLEQIGIEGLLAESEPSPKHMAAIIDEAKALHLHTVFMEPLSSSKAADTIAAAIGGKVDTLDPYEGLTKEEEAQGLDYYTVMDKNLKALVKSFQ